MVKKIDWREIVFGEKAAKAQKSEEEQPVVKRDPSVGDWIVSSVAGETDQNEQDAFAIVKRVKRSK